MFKGFLIFNFLKNNLRFILIIFYILLIFFLFQTELIDINIIIKYLINPFMLILSMLCGFLLVITTVFRWQIICSRHNVQTKFLSLLEIVCISNIAGQLLPGGQISGDFVRGALVGVSAKKDTNVLLSAIYIDRYYTVLTLFWLATALSFFFYSKIWVSPLTSILLQTIYMVTLILTASFILFQFSCCLPNKLTTNILWQNLKNKLTIKFVKFAKPDVFTAINNSKIYFLSTINHKIISIYLILLCIFGFFISSVVLIILFSPSEMNIQIMTEVFFSAITTWSVYLFSLTPGGIAVGELTFEHIYVALDPLIEAGPIAANIWFVHRVIMLFSNVLLLLGARLFNISAAKTQI